MPAKKNAQQVGNIECPECSANAAVFQNVKSYLYTRCPNCGCDQRNGKQVQERIYWNMRPIPDAPLTAPINVDENNPPEDNGKCLEQQEKEQPQQPTKQKNEGGIIGLIIIAGALGLGAAFTHIAGR